jgi:hypothetical protein
MSQVFNPYLPSWEYVPDGEPHVFGDRVYVYGSHDRFGAPIFCVNDYVCWSAPVDDLTDWRYEGVIFKKKQDPTNPLGIRSLYAPDVVQGTDGKFYLYYAFDFMGQIGVAVCDTPAGKYEYYGKVKFADGHIFGTKSGEPFPFDPGVLVDDDGRVYLYSGFATKVPFVASRWHNLNNEAGVVLELEPDMLTIKMGPKALFPTKGRKGAYKDHAFFEASSIRKVDGKYCFVYSSENNHELCYAMGETPVGPFTYGGTLVDVGDLYLNGNTDELHATNYLGNTHGGMCCIHGQWYIFYHRQTNRNSYARQACAEPLLRTADGGFKQAEITSCGLNGGPLCGTGTYEARIACNLWSKEGTYRYDAPDRKKVLKTHPYFTQSRPDRESDGDQYIANMRDGAVAGFKYFDFSGTDKINIRLRGTAQGSMVVSATSDFSHVIGVAEVDLNQNTTTFHTSLEKLFGVKPLFFRYEGSGSVDFIEFTLE